MSCVIQSKVLKFVPVTRDSELRGYILNRDFKHFLRNDSWLIWCIPSSYGCTREVRRGPKNRKQQKKRKKKSVREKRRKTKKDTKSEKKNTRKTKKRTK